MKYTLKQIIKFLIVIILPGIVGLFTIFQLNQLIFTAPDNKIDTLIFEIKPSEPLKTIAHNLKSEGVIRSEYALYALGRLKSLDKHIKAGDYLITKPMSVAKALKFLSSGKIIQIKVTIPEGSTLSQIAQIVASKNISSYEKIMEALKTSPYIDSLRIPNKSLEGYLFPETYHFTRRTDSNKVVETMINLGSKNWNSDYTDQADELGLTHHEILTLASIIEKESGNHTELKLISSVFHNRLKQGMKLQSDPTVIYGIKNFNGNLTKQDLLDPHPYNTYANNGLPPGPICSPGLEAIKAALYPSTSEFLYFVSNTNGSHEFSKTYEQHQLAVQKYQQNKS